MVVYAYLEDEGLVKYDFELEDKTWLVDYYGIWEIPEKYTTNPLKAVKRTMSHCYWGAGASPIPIRKVMLDYVDTFFKMLETGSFELKALILRTLREDIDVEIILLAKDVHFWHRGFNENISLNGKETTLAWNIWEKGKKPSTRLLLKQLYHPTSHDLKAVMQNLYCCISPGGAVILEAFNHKVPLKYLRKYKCDALAEINLGQITPYRQAADSLIRKVARAVEKGEIGSAIGEPVVIS
jgi:hypothetical protein